MAAFSHLGFLKSYFFGQRLVFGGPMCVRMQGTCVPCDACIACIASGLKPALTEASHQTFHIFTTQRYAKRGICRRRVSVCLSVCLSITLRYCIKTSKRRITQIMPHDSSGNLVSAAKNHGEIQTGSPPTEATSAGGVGEN